MELGLGSQQNGVLVNRTRAAEVSHLLDSSRRTIIQVEALVTVAAALLFLQLVLGTWKRRWHNSFVSGALSVCNESLLPLVFYTFSIMQSSPVKNSMYPVWGASLLMAAGGTNAVRLIDYDEKKSKVIMQRLTVIARYGFYTLILSKLMSPYSLMESFSLKALQYTGGASSMCISFLLLGHFFTRISEPAGLNLRHRLHMQMKKNANDHQNFKYPVGYVIHYLLPRPKVQVISINHIWNCCGNSHRGETLKDVCMSLALCQSLIKRYTGLSSVKAHLPATNNSFFNRLLTEEHYERAFRIIEIELGFCYDFFFTKYHSIYFGTIVSFPLFLWRVILATLVLVYTVQDSLTISTHDPIVQVQITRADYTITLVLLGTALVVELLQALVYLASDWTKVSLACQYVKHKPNAFLEKLTGTQLFYRRRFFFKFFLKCNLDPVEISPEIEKAIAGSIKPTFGGQTNRLASQIRNSMFEHWALKDHWTLKDHSQVEIMLIWHIATDYCHHLSRSSGDGSNPDRDVAVTLSRYCAYLLVFVPQLIPYHQADIRKLIYMMMQEIDDNLQSSGPSEIYQEMKEIGDDPCPLTVFGKGVKLGKQLEGMPDEAQRWKAMADFWAKTIIYIAPSHSTAREHMRQLENGGEFLTHIWALLSHHWHPEPRQGRRRSSNT